MKIFFAVLGFFLLAFAGLAAGLIFKRKGLRGGCSPTPSTGRDCRCKSEAGSDSEVREGEEIKADKD